MGGGAVGLARFGLHGVNCAPQHNAVVDEGPKYIRLSHYGPIGASVSTGKPVTVTFYPATGGSQNITSYVDVVMFPDGIQRDLLLVANANSSNNNHLFSELGLYVVQPVVSGANALKCAQVTGSPAVLPWTYSFRVIQP